MQKIHHGDENVVNMVLNLTYTAIGSLQRRTIIALSLTNKRFYAKLLPELHLSKIKMVIKNFQNNLDQESPLQVHLKRWQTIFIANHIQSIQSNLELKEIKQTALDKISRDCSFLFRCIATLPRGETPSQHTLITLEDRKEAWRHLLIPLFEYYSNQQLPVSHNQSEFCSLFSQLFDTRLPEELRDSDEEISSSEDDSSHLPEAQKGIDDLCQELKQHGLESYIEKITHKACRENTDTE